MNVSLLGKLIAGLGALITVFALTAALNGGPRGLSEASWERQVSTWGVDALRAAGEPTTYEGYQASMMRKRLACAFREFGARECAMGGAVAVFTWAGIGIALLGMVLTIAAHKPREAAP